jgi:hypothetical protein
LGPISNSASYSGILNSLWGNYSKSKTTLDMMYFEISSLFSNTSTANVLSLLSNSYNFANTLPAAIDKFSTKISGSTFSYIEKFIEAEVIVFWVLFIFIIVTTCLAIVSGVFTRQNAGSDSPPLNFRHNLWYFPCLNLYFCKHIYQCSWQY